MGKGNYGRSIREAHVDRQALHPVWRGIGFIFLALLTVGAFILSGYLLDSGIISQIIRYPISPGGLWTPVKGMPGIPIRWLVMGGITIVVDLLAFSVITMVWAILNPVKPGKFDAPPSRRKIKAKGR